MAKNEVFTETFITGAAVRPLTQDREISGIYEQSFPLHCQTSMTTFTSSLSRIKFVCQTEWAERDPVAGCHISKGVLDMAKYY